MKIRIGHTAPAVMKNRPSISTTTCWHSALRHGVPS